VTAPNLDDIQRWWALSLYDIDHEASYTSLTDYAVMKLPSVFFAQKALDAISGKLHKCRAKRPDQLRQWGYKQIDRLAAQLNKSEKSTRKGVKLFQCDETSAGVYSIPLLDSKGQQHTWKVPADWLGDIDSLIWPVHIRRHASGRPYLAKKLPTIWPTERKQTILPAHHIYLWFKYPGISDGDVACSRARNGDFLDWTNDNIYVPAFDGLALSESARAFQVKRAVAESSRKQINVGDRYETVPVSIDRRLIEEWERRLNDGTHGPRDIMECAYRADLDLTLLRDSSPNGHKGWPDKPNRPPGSDPAMDEGGDDWMHWAFQSGMNREVEPDCSENPEHETDL
jgi:hypothetical protein